MQLGQADQSVRWRLRRDDLWLVDTVAAAFELDKKSPVYGQVEFISHPVPRRAAGVSPTGGFSLAVPANLPKENVTISWKVMEYLTRPEMMKWYAQNGNLTSPRYFTSADPEVQSFSKLIRHLRCD